VGDPLTVIIVNSVRGIFQAFHVPTANAIIPTMVPKDKLSRINGVNYLFISLISLAGPVIGAFLLVYFPVEIILWVDVVTFGIAMVPLILVSIPKVRSPEEVQSKLSFFKEFKGGMKTIKTIPGILHILLLSMLLNFLIQPFNVLLPLWIRDVHGGDEFLLAIAMIFFQGGMIFGALVTSLKKEWKHKIPTYFTGLIIIMAAFSTLAFVPTYLFMLAGVAISIGAMFLPIVNTIYMTVVQTVVPSDKMGRVSSLDNALSMVISPFGALIAGPLAILIGINNVFFTSAIIGVIASIFVWQFTKVKHVNYDDTAALNTIAENINGIIE
jgi:DHA3 family macrolide efflux protein-like MFS transporter